MAELKFPVVKGKSNHWPKKALCPICGKNKVFEPHSMAVLYAGAMLMDRAKDDSLVLRSHQARAGRRRGPLRLELLVGSPHPACRSVRVGVRPELTTLISFLRAQKRIVPVWPRSPLW